MAKNKTKLLTRSYLLVPLALFCALLWGSAFPGIKIGYELFFVAGSYEKIMFAGIRFLLAAILIFAFSLLSKRKLILTKKSLMRLLALGLIQTSLQYILFYIGLSNTSGTKASILSATNTLFSVLLVHFFSSEDRLSLKKILGLILGFSGVIIVNLSGSGLGAGFTFAGDGFIILSSLLGALGGIYTKKLTEELDAFIISGYQLLLGSLFLIGAGFLGGGYQLVFSPTGLALLFYLSLVSALAFSIWSVLLKYNQVSEVTIFKFTIPLFGVLLSYILLGERLMGANVLLAIVLVSLSVILISR